MFSHMMVGSNDLERARRFYDALFTAVGGRPGAYDAAGRVLYMHNGAFFLVTKPIDGQPATVSNGATIGFNMDGPEQVEAWHKAGVEAGGEAIEEPPGERRNPAMTLYLAYLRDPDGNKLCALHLVPPQV